MDTITHEHVGELVCSPAVDAALVRYPDGSLEVRSNVSRGRDDVFQLIVLQDYLPELDQGEPGMDFDNLSQEDLEALAAQINLDCGYDDEAEQ